MKIPKEIVDKINLTDEEFEHLDVKIQSCIIRLASENVVLHDKHVIAPKLNEVLLDSPTIVIKAWAISREQMSWVNGYNRRIMLIRDDTCDDDSKSLRVFVCAKAWNDDKKLFGYVDVCSVKRLRKYDLFKYDHANVRVVKAYDDVNAVELNINRIA